MRQTIVILEDDKKIGRYVKAYLETAGFRVELFEKGRDAIAAIRANPPSLTILDLMLPDMKGEEVFHEIKEVGDIPVIMLTAKAEEEDRIMGFALGADDYVVKPFSPRELVFRVKAVLKRAEKSPAGQSRVLSFNQGALVIDDSTYSVSVNGTPANLTPTEFKVLHALSSYPEKVFTREEIVEQGLGYHFEGYERSVDVHIRNIRQKIEEDPKSPRFIMTVYGLGYRFTGKRDA